MKSLILISLVLLVATFEHRVRLAIWPVTGMQAQEIAEEKFYHYVQGIGLHPEDFSAPILPPSRESSFLVFKWASKKLPNAIIVVTVDRETGRSELSPNRELYKILPKEIRDRHKP